jgi:hypothetical protein
MKSKLVPASQGLVWVRQGLRIFFKRPMAFCLLFLIYLIVGPMLMLAVAPLATVGFMIATKQAMQGRFPMPSVYVEPLRASRPQRWAQVRLGLGYALGAAFVLWLGDAIGGTAFDALRQAYAAGKTTPEELGPLIGDSDLQWGWLVMLAGLALLSMPFWHAPALVHWGRQSARKALFFSTVACWRNKGALAMYALGWGAIVLLFALVVPSILAIAGMPQLAFAIVTPATLMISAAMYASLYFTFADSFEQVDDAAAALPSAITQQETP